MVRIKQQLQWNPLFIHFASNQSLRFSAVRQKFVSLPECSSVISRTLTFFSILKDLLKASGFGDSVNDGHESEKNGLSALKPNGRPNSDAVMKTRPLAQKFHCRFAIYRLLIFAPLFLIVITLFVQQNDNCDVYLKKQICEDKQPKQSPLILFDLHWNTGFLKRFTFSTETVDASQKSTSDSP